MTAVPLVSVIIPAFNVRECIGRAIDSALSQLDGAVEVIVVDDESTDDTSGFVAQRYSADKRVRVSRRPTNGGPGAARNQGFDLAKGEWVALLDGDDWWKSGRLDVMLKYADDYDFVADNIMGFDIGHGTETWPIYSLNKSRKLRLIDFIRPSSRNEHDLGYLQPLMRRSFIKEHTLKYQEDLRVGEDLLFNMQFMHAGGRGIMIKEAKYVYALPVGPISKTASPYSKTSADTQALIEEISTFRAAYAHVLSDDTKQAISLRLASLEARAPIATFHLAKARAEYAQMAVLALTNRQIQKQIYKRVIERSVGLAEKIFR